MSFRPPLNSFRPPQKWPAGGGEMSFGGGRKLKNFFALRAKFWHASRAGISPPPRKNPVAAPVPNDEQSYLSKQRRLEVHRLHSLQDFCLDLTH